MIDHAQDALTMTGKLKDAIYSFAMFGMTVQQRSLIEQHVGTILQLTVVGLLGWSLMTSVSLQRDVGILQSQLNAMQTTISQGTSDRYRGSDAARDQAAIWSDLNRKDQRLNQLEETFNKHKYEVTGMNGNGRK